MTRRHTSPAGAAYGREPPAELGEGWAGVVDAPAKKPRCVDYRALEVAFGHASSAIQHQANAWLAWSAWL
jgi:hypothetical protein